MNEPARKFHFNKPVGQVIAPQGHAIFAACPGPENCPHERSEDERLKRFEQNTGISCGKGARIILQRLLDDGHFDRRQLALAWRANSLWWDHERYQVRAKCSRLEEAYGLMLMFIGLLLCVGGAAGLILHNVPRALLELSQLVGLLLLFLSVAPFAEKYMVRPNRIARRAGPLLEAYYAGDGAGGGKDSQHAP